MDMMRIQAQIRQNATEMADYFKDLDDWEKEILQKDKAIKEGKIRAKPNSAGVRTPLFAEMIPAARAAEEEAASARVEQAIALKEDGNALLKQGDLQAALQKVRCDCLVAGASDELFLLLPKCDLAPSTRLRLR